jgi:hypothetical protein
LIAVIIKDSTFGLFLLKARGWLHSVLCALAFLWNCSCSLLRPGQVSQHSLIKQARTIPSTLHTNSICTWRIARKGLPAFNRPKNPNLLFQQQFWLKFRR